MQVECILHKDHEGRDNMHRGQRDEEAGDTQPRELAQVGAERGDGAAEDEEHVEDRKHRADGSGPKLTKSIDHHGRSGIEG